MTRRLQNLAIVLVALAAILPAAALGGTPKKHHQAPSGCVVSAVCVYHEYGQGASGSQSIGSSHAADALSARAAALLAKYGGKDRQLLTYLATRQNVPEIPGAHVGHVSTPGAILAALDLGAGPIALFVTLLAVAAALGLGRALRHRRAGAH